jgi:RNA polymerase sigma-70 factor (ECF subfamily)
VDEQELIDRAKTDPAAFGELYERYFGRIYGYVYQRIGVASEAEDVTAKVFYQALTSLPRYVDRGLPFSAWLFRIAHNLVANWHRDRSRRALVPLEDGDDLGVDPPSIDKHEEQDIIRRAISMLSAERQHLLSLKFWEGMTNADIGRVMGRTEGAVKALLHRTLDSLREHVESLDLAGTLDLGPKRTQQGATGK